MAHVDFPVFRQGNIGTGLKGSTWRYLVENPTEELLEDNYFAPALGLIRLGDRIQTLDAELVVVELDAATRTVRVAKLKCLDVSEPALVVVEVAEEAEPAVVASVLDESAIPTKRRARK